MPWITREGRTVEEAREAAIAEAGLPIEALDVEVVNEGARGLFGLGGEPAVVRVRPKDEATDFRHAFRDDITPAYEEAPPAQEEVVERERGTAAQPSPEVPAEAAADAQADEQRLSLSEQQEEAGRIGSEIVRGILERMQLEGDINTRVAGGTVYIEVFGDEMGILIGRSGATLEALQEIVRAGVQRRLKTRQALVVDVEAYWERRRRPGRGNGNRAQGGGERRRRGGRGRRSDEQPSGNR